MKTQDIKNMASAYMQVLESELEEKKKMDPVGQEDDDIDNDGDVDKSDEYLHNRRKTIKKAMKKEEVELDELKKSTLSSYIKKASGNMAGKTAAQVAQVSSNGKGDPDLKRGLVNRMKGISRAADKLAKEEVELDELQNTQESINMSMREKLQLQKEAILEKEMTAAEKKKREEIVLAMKDKTDDFKSKYGKRWKDVMYATATKQAMKEADEVLGKAKRRTSTCESTAPRTVYDRIKENRAAHYKGAAPGDPKMMDKMTASDKAFIDAHSANDLDGINSGIDGAKAAEDTAKNAASQVKAGAGMNRTGDQKTGDKNVVKSTEAK